jgi:glutathione S-transferase
MSGAERILYQFPISHYCEKTRWNLDAKGLSYRVHDLVPGWHNLTTRRLSRVGTVPVLLDRGVAVGDSSAIAAHLDRAYPERPLLPASEPLRARVLELEAYFGKRAGRAVRQWMYGQLAQRPGAIAALVLGAYSPAVRFAGKIAAPLLERAMRRMYRLDAASVARARETIDEVFDRVERETSGDPARYLAGDALSIADIAAASLLGPLVAPPGSPWAATTAPERSPPSITAVRAELARRPGWAWVVARYAGDRRPVASA